ncbi:MAG: hypothetical protein RL685_3300 [Pseudomonadota bacterium]|jgi:hypothetical protein
MQPIAPARAFARYRAKSCRALSCRALSCRALLSLGVLLSLGACTTSAPVMGYSEAIAAAEATPGFALFTSDPVLQEAALRAQQRIEAAIGDTGLTLAAPDTAAACQPFDAGCGFQLRFDEVVHCQGDPAPALACTAQGTGGSTLGVKLQATLAGEELDNRLIHELLHVITWNRAPHASDGLFMEYSVGDERITEGTLDAVCAHFSCSRFVAEEAPSPFAR